MALAMQRVRDYWGMERRRRAQKRGRRACTSDTRPGRALRLALHKGSNALALPVSPTPCLAHSACAYEQH